MVLWDEVAAKVAEDFEDVKWDKMLSVYLLLITLNSHHIRLCLEDWGRERI